MPSSQAQSSSTVAKPSSILALHIGAYSCLLVSGYFRLPHDIPKPIWRYLMSYISFHFWALQINAEGQYQNNLQGLLFDNQTPDLPKIPGEYILENVSRLI